MSLFHGLQQQLTIWQLIWSTTYAVEWNNFAIATVQLIFFFRFFFELQHPKSVTNMQFCFKYLGGSASNFYWIYGRMTLHIQPLHCSVCKVTYHLGFTHECYLLSRFISKRFWGLSSENSATITRIIFNMHASFHFKHNSSV